MSLYKGKQQIAGSTKSISDTIDNVNVLDTYDLLENGEKSLVNAQDFLDKLADAVANKLIAKASLVNNATTTEAGVSALDAVMGKTLQEQITKLNSDSLRFMGVFNGDFNATDITPGIYEVSGTTTSNNPLNTNIYGIFIQYPDSYHTQKLIISTINGVVQTLSRRYKTGTSTWVEWSEVALKSDFPGLYGNFGSLVLNSSTADVTSGEGSEICLYGKGGNSGNSVTLDCLNNVFRIFGHFNGNSLSVFEFRTDGIYLAGTKITN